MAPWVHKFRRLILGSSASDVPSPRSRWAEQPEKVEQQAVLPKQSFLLKFRRFIGVFLVINVGIGGYLIAKTTPKSNKKHRGSKKESASTEAPVSVSAPPARVHHRKVTANEQRQLFQWMLDEKRKLKPANPEDKARIDEDKKILKQFLRSTNLPQL